ncbi:uncharacterized protein LOC131640588 [Vicia villosa]|uniref:uncharacterized protein LOC131640588 n=1 Tax=Vicia villosa TaxID=3911 RepID=UPI00273BD40B|nr:uncharacterized protein LOC131640588 [Vicia villosa]
MQRNHTPGFSTAFRHNAILLAHSTPESKSKSHKSPSNPKATKSVPRRSPKSDFGRSRKGSVASVLEEAKELQDSVAGHISKSLSDEHPLRQRALALDSKILSLRFSLDSLLNNKLINHSLADKLDEDLQRDRCIVVDGDASSLLPGHAHG